MEAPLTMCRLCRNTRPLQNSHLLPQAAYKPLRDDKPLANPHPVTMTRKTTLATAKQVTAYLLCSDCETLFSQKGENYVVTQCVQRDGQFRLREQLQAATPLCSSSTPQFTAYDAISILGDRLDSYLYFAASIFWRTAAHSWKLGNNQRLKLSLGETYQEQFRLYLLGQDSFPSNGSIYLHVASEVPSQLLQITFPSSVRRGRLDAHRHKFYMLGLIFALFLGGKTSQLYTRGALNSTQPCILLRPWSEDSLFQANIDMAMASTPIGVRRRLR